MLEWGLKVLSSGFGATLKKADKADPGICPGNCPSWIVSSLSTCIEIKPLNLKW